MNPHILAAAGAPQFDSKRKWKLARFLRAIVRDVSRLGSLLAFAPEAQFKLLSGEANLTNYKFKGREGAYAPHESPTGETADLENGLAGEAILVAHRAAVINDDHAASVLSEVPHYDAGSVAQAPAATVRGALKQLSPDVSAVWLHTDLGALSTRALSAVDYKLPGGLIWPELSTVETARLVIEALGR